MTNPEWRRALELYESTCSLPPDAAKALIDSSGEIPAVVNAVHAVRAGEREEEDGSDPDANRAEATEYAGCTIGRYDVIVRIGRGSSGEVYSGRDRELGRAVALKFLSTDFAGVGSATKRFIREAQAASALNHPNIVTVHDVITWKSLPVIVMELVEGVTLRAFSTQSMPLERVIAIGWQMSQALVFAHANGIVHRDLKPENVMVRPDGYIKLLDLGLARRTMPDPGKSSTAGMPVGTLSYMSPEQCRGEPVTSASDVFSLGIVLYELATGTHPFEKGSLFETLEALNYLEPPAPSSLVASALLQLDELILKMMAKDPRQRPPAVEVARRLELSSPLQRPGLRALDAPDPAGVSVRATQLRETATSHWRRRLRYMGDGVRVVETGATDVLPRRVRVAWMPALLTAVAIAAGLAILWVPYLLRPEITAAETRVDIVAPPTDDRTSFALSPDGRRIVFSAVSNRIRRLWVRTLDSTSAQPVIGTEGAISPFWSPDGRSVGFFSDYKLKRIDLEGAWPQTLAAAPSLSPQGTWGDGTILFTPTGLTPVLRVPASGGQTSVAIQLDKAHMNQLAPRFLPGGRQFFVAVNGPDPSIWLGSLDGAAPRRITSIMVETDSVPEFLPSGWLVRVRQNVLEAQRFDPRLGRLSGAPKMLDQSVRADTQTLAGSFSVSASGTIAWRSGGGRRRQLMWFNRSGENVVAFGDVGDSTLFSPQISPDGKRVATMRGPVGSSDIWVQESARNRRLTLDPADDRYPLWSPDGTHLAFASNRNGAYDLYEKAADGSGVEQVLLQSAELKRPNSWSPDGRFLLYCASQINGDLMILPLSGDRKPFPFVNTPFDEQQGVFSPDGRWVAYQSDESGRFEVYVRPFPGPGGPSQVSVGGGHSPRWRSDGKELYYLAPDLKLMAAKVSAQAGNFIVREPEFLFQTHIIQATNQQQYDVSSDGRFLILTDLPDTSTEPIHLLLNWNPKSR